MRSLVFLSAFFCVLSGCAEPSRPARTATHVVSVPATPSQEQAEVPAAASPVGETEAIPEEESDPAARSAVEQMINAALMDEAVKKTVAEATGEPPAAAPRLALSPDITIAENRWGFSVYDPGTGVTEYFYNDGVKIGSDEGNRVLPQADAGTST